uniref:TATA binding protein of transcription factor IIB n=1 Tax=Amorphochlora amoebiformis TaxID=1561963 RepID=A0A0H5BHP8_9EUKA|nr:TATA binding protein of transcription factor IIB [Amorphochlora amoebiformis]
MQNPTNACCRKYHFKSIIKNITTGEYTCKYCGTILYYLPYNDGSSFEIYGSNVDTINKDRVGSSSYATNEVFTTVNPIEANKHLNFHVVSNNSKINSVFNKIDEIRLLMNLQKKVSDLAKKIYKSYGKSINSRKILTKSSGSLYIACETFGITKSIKDFCLIIPDLKEKELFKTIKAMKFEKMKSSHQVNQTPKANNLIINVTKACKKLNLTKKYSDLCIQITKLFIENKLGLSKLRNNESLISDQQTIINTIIIISIIIIKQLSNELILIKEKINKMFKIKKTKLLLCLNEILAIIGKDSFKNYGEISDLVLRFKNF